MKRQLVKILNHVNSQMHRRFLFFILKNKCNNKIKRARKNIALVFGLRCF